MPTRIAFLDILTADKESFRAAALVTDTNGDPIEFRTTSTVKPTRLQKILWGRRLAGHLYVSSLALPILEALSESPSLVVVRHRLLLDVRPLVKYPVVCFNAKSEEAGAKPG